MSRGLVVASGRKPLSGVVLFLFFAVVAGSLLMPFSVAGSLFLVLSGTVVLLLCSFGANTGHQSINHSVKGHRQQQARAVVYIRLGATGSKKDNYYYVRDWKVVLLT